jgi:hypothetical protein
MTYWFQKGFGHIAVNKGKMIRLKASSGENKKPLNYGY